MKARSISIVFSVFAILAILVLPYASVQASASAPSRDPYRLLAQAAQAYAPMKAAVNGSGLEVVAEGLNNPRGLAFGADGALYVAEAGLGGEGPCVVGPEGNVCYGPSGSIMKIKDGVQQRLITGLPSLADPAGGGFAATGPHDVSPRMLGLDVVIGLGNDPAARQDLGPAGSGFGSMVRVLHSGIWGFFSDISTHEAVNDPDGGGADSNPYSLTSVRNGLRVVADAGGNDLVGIFGNGRAETFAIFPDRMVDAPPFLGLPPGAKIAMEAVPTSVVIGPDGAFYAGQLTGFPFPVGGANVYRIGAPGMEPEVFADGFTNIIDITFDKNGNLYVLEITAKSLLSGDLTGALTRVAKDGTRDVLAREGLVAPGGLIIGADGSIYISNFSVFPGAGQVVRLSGAALAGPQSMQLDGPDAMDALSRTFIPLVRK